MAGRGGRCSWGAPGRAPWSKTRAVPRQMRAASKRERGRVAPRYPPRPRAPDGPPSPSAAGRAVQRRRRVPMSTRLLCPRPAPRRFQAGQTHAPALAASPVVPSGGAMSAWPRGGRLAARTALERRTCHPAPHWRSTRALCSGRVARAHGSVRAWECDSDRALGRRSPGQPVADQSSPGARRTQQADVVRDLRALWATTRRRPPSTGVVRDSSTEAQTSNLGETSYRLQKPFSPRGGPLRRIQLCGGVGTVSLETNFLRRQRARRPRSQGAAAVKHLGRKIFLGTRAEEPTCSTVAKRSPAARVFNDHTCGAL